MSIEAIYKLAAKQHGVIKYEQARKFGEAQQIRDWVKQGRLLKPAPLILTTPFAKKSWEHRVRVALWSFPRAVLCGPAAARWWGLPAFKQNQNLTLIAPWACRSRKTSEKTTFTSYAVPSRMRNGILVTPIERTIADVAACIDAKKLTYAVSEVFFQNFTTLNKLYSELEGLPPRHRGFDALYRELESRTTSDEKLRSHFEKNVLTVIRKRGLPEPEPDYLLCHAGGKYYADFCWPDQKLVVEVDGPQHLHPEAVKYDGERDSVFVSYKYSVLNFRPETDADFFIDLLSRALSGS